MAITWQNNAEGATLGVNMTTSNQGASGDVVTPGITNTATIMATSDAGKVVHGSKSWFHDGNFGTDHLFYYKDVPYSPGYGIRAEFLQVAATSGSGYKQTLVGAFIAGGSLHNYVRWNGDGTDTWIEIVDSVGTVNWASAHMDTLPVPLNTDGTDFVPFTIDFRVDFVNQTAQVRAYNNWFSLATPLIQSPEVSGNFALVGTPTMRNMVGHYRLSIGTGSGGNKYSSDSGTGVNTYDFVGVVDDPRVSLPLGIGLVNTAVRQVRFTSGQLPINFALADGSKVSPYMKDTISTAISGAVIAGTRFTVAASVWTVGTRYYKQTSGSSSFLWDNAVATVGLWIDSTGEMIAYGKRTQAASDPAGSWITVNWTDPVLLIPGVTYTVGMIIPPGRATFFPSISGSAVRTIGPISTVTSVTGSATSISRPTSVFVGTTLPIDPVVTYVAPVEVRRGVTPWIRRSVTSAPVSAFTTADGGNFLVMLVESYGTSLSSTPPGWTLEASIDPSSSTEVGLYVLTKIAVAGENQVTTSLTDGKVLIYEFPNTYSLTQISTVEDGPDSGATGPALTSLSGLNQIFYVVAHPRGPSAPVERLPAVGASLGSTANESYFSSDGALLSVWTLNDSAASSLNTTSSVVPADGNYQQLMAFAVSNQTSTVSVIPIAAGLSATAKTVAVTTGTLPIGVPLLQVASTSLFENYDAPDVATTENYPTIGTKFTATQNIWVTGARYYGTATINNVTYKGKTLEAGLWDASGNLIASGWFVEPGLNQATWRTIKFSAPVKLINGSHYTVGFRPPTVGASRPYGVDADSGGQTSITNGGFATDGNTPDWAVAADSGSDIAGPDYLILPEGDFVSAQFPNEYPNIDIQGQLVYPNTTRSWIRQTTDTFHSGNSTPTMNFQGAVAGNFLVAVIASIESTTSDPAGWTRQSTELGNTELSVFTKTAVAGESSLTITQSGIGGSVAFSVFEFPAGSSWDTAYSTSGAGLTSPVSTSGYSGTHTILAMTSMMLSQDGDTPTTLWSGRYNEAASLATPCVQGSWNGVQLSVGAIENFFDSALTTSSTTVSKYNTSREITVASVSVPTTQVGFGITAGLVGSGVKTIAQAGTRTLGITVGLTGTAKTVAKTTGSLSVGAGLTSPLTVTVSRAYGELALNVALSGLAAPIKKTSGHLDINVATIGTPVALGASSGLVRINASLAAVASIFQVSTTGSLPISILLQSKVSTMGTLPINVDLDVNTAFIITRTAGQLPVGISYVATLTSSYLVNKGYMNLSVNVAATATSTVAKISGELPIFIAPVGSNNIVYATTGEFRVDAGLRAAIRDPSASPVVSVGARPIRDGKNFAKTRPQKG